MSVRARLTAVLPLVLTGCGGAGSAPVVSKPAVDSAAYAEDTKAWRVLRLDAIAGPDGWSTLAGLFWLDSAESRIGSDARRTQFVLPADHTPPVLGTITRQNSTVRFAAAPGVSVTRDSTRTRTDTVTLVSDRHPSPTVLTAGTVTLRLIERGGKLAIRVKDSAYVLRRDFVGLDYFPLDTSRRVLARLVPHATPRTLRVLNVTGQTDEYASPGTLEFTIDGVTHTMIAAQEKNDDKLFLIFRDSTSRTTTYPAGRFMYAEKADASGHTILDFNRAYNPPCAFTAFATCPLPPPENMLKVALSVGEKRYRGPHGDGDETPRTERAPR